MINGDALLIYFDYIIQYQVFRIYKTSNILKQNWYYNDLQNMICKPKIKGLQLIYDFMRYSIYASCEKYDKKDGTLLHRIYKIVRIYC